MGKHFVDRREILFLPKHRSEESPSPISRRSFIKRAIVTALPLAFPRLSFSYSPGSHGEERSLSFYHTHTGETLHTLYWAQGEYVTEALAEINYILRDFRTDEVKAIETRLLDLLYAMRMKLGTQHPFHIISGYRCQATNALLSEQNRGVVKNSLHLYGLAADVCIPGCPLSSLRKAALSLKGGGVGYYPKSDFVHIDAGRVRTW